MYECFDSIFNDILAGLDLLVNYKVVVSYGTGGEFCVRRELCLASDHFDPSPPPRVWIIEEFLSGWRTWR